MNQVKDLITSCLMNSADLKNKIFCNIYIVYDELDIMDKYISEFNDSFNIAVTTLTTKYLEKTVHIQTQRNNFLLAYIQMRELLENKFTLRIFSSNKKLLKQISAVNNSIGGISRKCHLFSNYTNKSVYIPEDYKLRVLDNYNNTDIGVFSTENQIAFLTSSIKVNNKNKRFYLRVFLSDAKMNYVLSCENKTAVVSVIDKVVSSKKKEYVTYINEIVSSNKRFDLLIS